MSSSPRSNCSILVIPLVGLLISLVSNSLALDPTQPLGQFRLVRWGEDQGLPQNLTPRIAQTKDGFLWLGFNHGLIRFDGKNFAVGDEIHANIKLPPDIFALLPTSSGELWIGSEGAVYCRLANGEFKRFDTKNGLPDDYFNSLFFDGESTIWIGTENHGLFQYKHNQFLSYPGSVDLARQEIFGMCETPGGDLWFGTAFGVYRMGKASGQIKKFSNSDGLPGEQVYALTVDREGRVWAGTQRGLARMNKEAQFQAFRERIGDRSIQALMTDSHGMIWVSASGGGLWRIKPETGEISELPPENGRPVPNIRRVFEDREGNIWLATSIGLERLSNVKFATYTTRDGLPSDDVVAVASGADGRIWIGTNDGLARLDRGKLETISWSSNGGPNPAVTVLYEDPQGVLWFGLQDATLHRLEGALHLQIAKLSSASGPGYATSICTDERGNLWVGTNGAGLELFRNGQIVKTFSQEDGLRDRAIFSLGFDREQTLWIGEGLSADVLKGPQIKPLPGENGQVLHSTVFSFYADTDGTLWIGTFNGLCRYKDGRWAPVVYRPTERGAGPEFYCLLEDDHGNIWSNGPHGVFFVPKRELNDFFDGKRSSVSCQAFGEADGLKSPQYGNSDGYFQAGCRSPDGRFWFATSSGLAVIDPNHLQLNSLPPPVQIEQVVVDLAQVIPFRPVDPRIELGPGTHSLEFDYAGLSFSAPEKVRFKYQLKGFDKNWIDAGARREAYYTNLPPGSYQFRVIACNNDGLWIPENAAATTTLIVQPHFYQTIWFYLLCAGAVLGAIPVLWRWRLQQILEERTRLARELHDTVARGVVGLIWQIEGAKSAAQKNRFDQLFPSLDAAAKLARESLRETRRAMRALRSGVLDNDRCFEAALEAVLARTAEGTHLRPELKVFGAPHQLGPAWEQALVRIAQESLTNTLKHAKANQFEVELCYNRRETRLRLHDDGIGFDYQPGGGSAGHVTAPQANGISSGLGLLGIEERCRQLGGRVQIASSSSEGTTIEIIVPRHGLVWSFITSLFRRSPKNRTSIPRPGS